MPCNLCGSQETLQRKAIKQMLQDWERQQPGRVENVFRALTSVAPSQLADRNLFDFAALAAARATSEPARLAARRCGYRNLCGKRRGVVAVGFPRRLQADIFQLIFSYLELTPCGFAT